MKHLLLCAALLVMGCSSGKTDVGFGGSRPPPPPPQPEPTNSAPAPPPPAPVK